MVHVGQVFDGSRDDLVTFMQENGYKFQAKAGHDEFFAKDAQKWNKHFYKNKKIKNKIYIKHN